MRLHGASPGTAECGGNYLFGGGNYGSVYYFLLHLFSNSQFPQRFATIRSTAFQWNSYTSVMDTAKVSFACFGGKKLFRFSHFPNTESYFYVAGLYFFYGRLNHYLFGTYTYLYLLTLTVP